MDGVGHFLMLEDPERFNATLAEAVEYVVGLAKR
jgi:pimeloyl-ACP methyl ester carboxylesterase